MNKPRGFQTCRRCGVKKHLDKFPTKGRDCIDCIADGPTGNLTHRGVHDPFRYGIDIKGLDRFLRKPVVTISGEHRVK